MSAYLFLDGQHVILASASPRRRDLLHQIQLHADIIPSTFEENLPKSSFPTAADYVMATARGKACQVAAENREAVVIGADTVVLLDQKILEKPADEKCAREMLAELSGRSHQVSKIL